MNNFPDNHNGDNYLENAQETEEIKEISPQKKREFQKLFIFLLTFGLIIGVIVSVIFIKVMTKFGLTDKTPQIEQLRK